MSDVSIKVNAPASTIVMERPQSGNALSRSMVAAIEQALDDLHQEKRVRYVILTGAGNHFCSGMDLKELHEQRHGEDLPSLAAVHESWVHVAELLQTMLRFPKPLIAAVDGAAIGAGLALALASDLVVASERATFSAPAIQHGLVGGVVAPLVAFRMGGAAAARLLIAGDLFDAEQARSLGLVSRMVPSDQIWVAADALGRQSARGPREALQMTKRLLNETIGESLASQLTIGAGMGATACSTEAAAEGLRAFAENRPPVWP